MGKTDSKGDSKMYFSKRLVFSFVVLSFLSVGAVLGQNLKPHDILVADFAGFGGTGKIIHVAPTSGIQTVFATGGFLIDPIGVTLSRNGDVLVADADRFGSGAVIQINQFTKTQTVVSSGGYFVFPFGIAEEAIGNIVVMDRDSDGGFFGSLLGAIIRVAPNGDQTIVSSGGLLQSCSSITIESGGDFIVTRASPSMSGIVRVSAVNGHQEMVSTGGFFDTVAPSSTVIDKFGNILVACRGGGGLILRINPMNGAQQVVSSEGGLFGNPFGIGIGLAGDIFFSDFTVFGGAGQGAILRVIPLTGAQATLSVGVNFSAPRHLVIVPTPADLLLDLIDAVMNLNLQQGINNSLDAKLDAAVQALEDINTNNDAAASNVLQAFINAVQAQSGNQILEADADALIAAVQQILNLLQCG